MEPGRDGGQHAALCQLRTSNHPSDQSPPRHAGWFPALGLEVPAALLSAPLERPGLAGSALLLSEGSSAFPPHWQDWALTTALQGSSSTWDTRVHKSECNACGWHAPSHETCLRNRSGCVPVRTNKVLVIGHHH